MSDFSHFKKTLVETARGQIGVRESGSNAGAQIRAFQSSTWLEPGPWPWCAAFVCWCFRVASLGHPLPFPLPDTPRALELASKWARGRATVLKNPLGVIAGDIVVFRFDSGHHCGIVAGASVGGSFPCIEGNTNGDGIRDGDGVYLKNRRLNSSVIFAIRL